MGETTAFDDAPIEAIVTELGGRMTGPASGSCRCPAHEDTSPSLSVSLGHDGRLLWHCFAGCETEAVLAALQQLGLAAGEGQRVEIDEEALRRIREEEARLLRRRIDWARQTWCESLPAAGTDVEAYLRSRAIRSPIPATLRYSPAAYESACRTMPAMIVAVVDIDGTLTGVHRTFLEGARKAAIERPKRMLGACAGSAVRLSDGPGRLIVAEGLETGLSVLDSLGGRVWATLSTTGMKRLVLPDQAGELLIMADGEDAGRKAAQRLADRAMASGWTVKIASAPDGMDWNDVAQEAALEAGHAA
ncbi:MAG: toprim domain-containing protein [Kiloniellales bacterium]